MTSFPFPFPPGNPTEVCRVGAQARRRPARGTKSNCYASPRLVRAASANGNDRGHFQQPSPRLPPACRWCRRIRPSGLDGPPGIARGRAGPGAGDQEATTQQGCSLLRRRKPAAQSADVLRGRMDTRIAASRDCAVRARFAPLPVDTALTRDGSGAGRLRGRASLAGASPSRAPSSRGTARPEAVADTPSRRCSGTTRDWDQWVGVIPTRDPDGTGGRTCGCTPGYSAPTAALRVRAGAKSPSSTGRCAESVSDHPAAQGGRRLDLVAGVDEDLEQPDRRLVPDHGLPRRRLGRIAL